MNKLNSISKSSNSSDMDLYDDGSRKKQSKK